MHLAHDQEADAIYITLREGAYAYGEDLDHERRIDYDAQGRPLGIELLNVSRRPGLSLSWAIPIPVRQRVVA